MYNFRISEAMMFTRSFKLLLRSIACAVFAVSVIGSAAFAQLSGASYSLRRISSSQIPPSSWQRPR